MNRYFIIIVASIVVCLTGCSIKTSEDEMYAKNYKELYSCSSFLIHEKVDRIVEVTIDNSEKIKKNKNIGKIFSKFDDDIPFEISQFKSRLKYLKEHPRHVASVLSNASKYIEMVYEEVKKNNLPAEIVIIPMIESMYNPKAQSPQGPGGMWQFTAQTARNFGLKVGKGIDERKDPFKATKAAVKYLSYLYKMVDGDFDTMVAAYNAGEGRVKRLYGKGESSNRHSNYDNVKMPDFTRGYLYHIFAYSHYLRNMDLDNFKMLPTKKKVVKKDTKRKWVSIYDFAQHHGRTVRDVESKAMNITKREYEGNIYCEIEFIDDKNNQSNINLQTNKPVKVKKNKSQKKETKEQKSVKENKVQKKETKEQKSVKENKVQKKETKEKKSVKENKVQKKETKEKKSVKENKIQEKETKEKKSVKENKSQKKETKEKKSVKENKVQKKETKEQKSVKENKIQEKETKERKSAPENIVNEQKNVLKDPKSVSDNKNSNDVKKIIVKKQEEITSDFKSEKQSEVKKSDKTHEIPKLENASETDKIKKSTETIKTEKVIENRVKN